LQGRLGIDKLRVFRDAAEPEADGDLVGRGRPEKHAGLVLYLGRQTGKHAILHLDAQL